MNKILFGMVVDEELHREYQNKKYSVCGREMSLDDIQIMCVKKDGEGLSKDVQEAKKIAEKIQKEIREYYAAKDGRKEYTTMKHNTFDEYLKDLQEIHAKVAPERMELKQEWEKAQKRWQEDQEEYKYDEHGLAVAKVRYLDAQEKYKNSVKELQGRTQEEIQAVQAEYEKHVTDFYSANGNRLDDAAVRLLNSEIKLTDAEIDGMVDQNRSNPTMLRLISDHCEKQGIVNKAAREYGWITRKSGTDEREAFNTVANMVRNAVSKDEITSNIWAKADSYFKQLSDQQIGAMGSFLVRPMAEEKTRA